jgi:hypothetical protein
VTNTAAESTTAEDVIGTLKTKGEGIGASFVLIGKAGAFAASGRGQVSVCGSAGLGAVGVTALMAFMLYFQDRSVTPSRTFGALHVAVPPVWFAIGCSIAIRQLKGASPDHPNPTAIRNLGSAES